MKNDAKQASSRARWGVSNRDAVAPARPADAEAILDLLMNAFGESYLKFSVYQARQAKAFLFEQIRDSSARSAPTFFVLRREGRLEGFYNAEKLGEEFFLKYIATDANRVRRGVGGVLLDHFEATAAAMGCQRAGLGVFESNAVAAPWYSRRGYRVESSELFLRYKLVRLDAPQATTLEWDTEDFDQAILTERERGFSAVTAILDGISIRLGLIAGQVVNLLELRDATPFRAATAVASSFSNHRRWLLMRTRESDVLPAVEPETRERSLHMVRDIL